VPADFTIEKAPMMGLERRIIQSVPAPAR